MYFIKVHSSTVVDPNLLDHYAPEIWVNADPDSAYEDFANADRNLC